MIDDFVSTSLVDIEEDVHSNNAAKKRSHRVRPNKSSSKTKRKSGSRVERGRSQDVDECDEIVAEFILDHLLLLLKFALDFLCSCIYLDEKCFTGFQFTTEGRETLYERIKAILAVLLLVLLSVLGLMALIVGIVLMFFFNVQVSLSVTLTVLLSVFYVVSVFASILYSISRLLSLKKKIFRVRRKYVVAEIQKMLRKDLEKEQRLSDDSFTDNFIL